VGRPDLLGKDATERLSDQLFETVTQRLATLPDDLIVYPGHMAGSACGKKIGDAPHTSIGQEKMGNYAFHEKERDAFVQTVMKDMPTPPIYYPVLKRVNKQGAVLINELIDPQPLGSNEVKELAGEGAMVVDTRDKADFGQGHIAGSLFVGSGPNFHTWMGWVAPYDRDIVLITGDNGSVDEVVTALRQIGLDRVVGYLDGGMKAWDGETETLEQITVRELWQQRDNRLAVLDVRSDAEWRDGHIEGARYLFAGEIVQGAIRPDPSGADRGHLRLRVSLLCGVEHPAGTGI
jgi:hydroxyacylglutathione hydrolase